MIELTQQSDKYDWILDKIHELIDLSKVDPKSDYSSIFNEVVDFLFDNFRVNKSATMLMTLDIERLTRESLLVLNSTNLVYGVINGLVRFSRNNLEQCFTTSDGFKKFTDELWNAATAATQS